MMGRMRASPLSMASESGFTLIEMLVAVALFAMLVAICYAALGPAADGFRDLAKARDALGRTELIGRQLRTDAAYAMATQDQRVVPFSLQADRRGAAALDQLTLITHEIGLPTLVRVHYFVDESRGMLVRESSLPWARDGVQPMRWDLGPVKSFRVEAMDAGGGWLQRWPGKGLPRAIRVTLRDAHAQRQWVLPIDAQDAAALQSQFAMSGTAR